MFYILKNRLIKGVVTRPPEVASLEKTHDARLRMVGDEFSKLIQRRFGRSFNLRQVDTGSCGACVSEIITITNPLYDVARFGVNFVASPRHADALLVTGPVSKNMRCALLKTYDAMPEPKLVITLGDCAKNGGVFERAYYTHAGVGEILPVSLHIGGCPPRPAYILEELLKLLSAMKE